MKKIEFTDSNQRDFEFWIYDTLVVFYYFIDRHPRLAKSKYFDAHLRVSDIEKGIFPASLNDFSEAKLYLVKYFEHIAFV